VAKPGEGEGPLERKSFKALDDVSFSVREGEVLGIISHNAAGKRTMLKLMPNTRNRCQAQSSLRRRRASQ
jgi:ABC-type polysaccharide/polyol phosphate transport system ATPase subunit